MKLALISFDGIDPRVIYDNEIKLPHFHNFMDDAMHGIIQTSGHTIPSYIQTLTGLPYHETNFYWDVETGGFNRHRQTGYEFIWDFCEASMTLLNIPVIYPPEDINGVIISGMLAPDDVADTNLTTDDEVQQKLNEINYIHEVRADEVFDELGAEGMLNLLYETMDKRVEAAEWLINNRDNDLFYGVWTSTDRWFHRHHTHGVDYFKMYQKANDVLNQLLNIIPDDVPIWLFSDHGFAHLPQDDPVHTGHMYEGWYAVQHPSLPAHRNDSMNIFDIFATTVNYLECNKPAGTKGRIQFHREDQNQEVQDKLKDLGYME